MYGCPMCRDSERSWCAACGGKAPSSALMTTAGCRGVSWAEDVVSGLKMARSDWPPWPTFDASPDLRATALERVADLGGDEHTRTIRARHCCESAARRYDELRDGGDAQASYDEMSEQPDAIAQLAEIVMNDVLDAFLEILRHDTQHHRRSFVRASIAAIEAFTSMLKQEIIGALPNLSHHYSPGEVSLLKEESYNFSRDHSTVTSKPRFMPTPDNFCFAVTMYRKRTDHGFRLELGGRGWKSLREAVKIRNRIVHPRDAGAMQISDDELEVVKDAYGWAKVTLEAALRAMKHKLARRVQELQEAKEESERAMRAGRARISAGLAELKKVNLEVEEAKAKLGPGDK